ncbi:hypothetical protein ABMA70_09520 [Halobacteriovorax sp. XZX-3]|uniref:hypothetical protein n=1 Tax=unclassified Halobacteriovorax TaxID=2639665 RepID=UPI000CD08593|nr:hypothetical protein [Halobacteriovorax sp. DA5]POB13171.1 hypothetical protein C0Z22_11685 [Halobacteriovorax sp. DA5]
MELIITLPLWLIVIQLMGSLLNSKEILPILSLKRYLASTHNIERVDALSFNSFIVILFLAIFGQTLSAYFLLTNEIRYILPFYALIIATTVFVGIFRFRLSLIRSEIIEKTQIVLTQAIILSILLLVYSLIQSNIFLLKLCFSLPLLILFYTTEVEVIKAGTIYSDKKYISIQCSYVRLLYQCLVTLFFINLTFTNSDWSHLFKAKFDSVPLYYFVLTLFVLFFQAVLIILSNTYLKFQPLKDYSTILLSARSRTVYSLVVVMILCITKVFNVF